MDAGAAFAPGPGGEPRDGGKESGPTPGTRAPSRAPLWHLPDWTLIAPPAVTLAVMLWSVSTPSYWADEADTVSAVSRSLPQLARLLGHVDAVHGLYYLLLWPLAKVAGTGEFATRLPSVAAMTAAALGVAAIGRRLRSRRAGLCAGLVFAALPMVTMQGHNARPYAIATAAAVLASQQAIRAADNPRPRRLAAYGLSLVLLGYLELFALLLVPAHAISLTAFRRQGNHARHDPPGPRWGPSQMLRSCLARRWLATIAAVGAAVAPVIFWGWRQRGQIGWISKPGWADAGHLASSLAAGSAPSVIVIMLLAVLGGRRGDSPARAGPPARAGARQARTRQLAPARGTGLGRGLRAHSAGQALTWLAAPWLVLPPLALLAASEIKPVYSFRYITFCLPAAALLAGAGLAALGPALRAAATALIVALVLPAQLAMRGPRTALPAAAQVLAAHQRPGDAIIYPGSGIPPWYLAYPQAYRHLRNIGLAQTGAAAGRLYGTSVPLPVLIRRERGIRRIWAVEIGPDWRNVAPYIAPGFRLVREWRPEDGSIRLYQRFPAASR